MTRQDATKELRALLDSNGLEHWKMRLVADVMKPFLGMCDYRNKTIILNALHVDSHGDKEVSETIKHEVAHALCPNDGHNENWKAKAISLGCSNPTPCVTYSFDASAIDAIRSGATLEVSYEERIVREPKYKITKFTDKCPECGKVAKSVKVSEVKLGKNWKRITRLECGHLVSEPIDPISAFENLAFDGAPNCKHEWGTGKLYTYCANCSARRLYPFQVEGAKAIERHNGKFAVLDEPGLGKTIQALSYLKFHKEAFPVLWVTKSSAKYQHGKEAFRILGILPQVINGGTETPIPGFAFYICSYDIFRRQDLEMWKARGIQTIVLDEVQAIKNPDSTRTQCIRRLIRDVDTSGNTREIPRIIPTSGSFWKNRGSEAFVMLNLLDPKQFYSFQHFKDYHVDYYWQGNKKKEAGLKNAKTFLDKISHIAIRREREQVMPELPLITRNKFMCELDGTSKKIYDEEATKIKNIFDLAVIGGEEDSFEAKKAMQASIMVMRRIIGIAKVPTTLELVQEFMEETNRKLIVFVHHIDCGQMIYNAMKVWCAENGEAQPLQLTGGMNAQDREQVAVKFNSKNYRLLIASTLASGEAINLQTCADCIMHERQWNPMNEEQAEGRMIRIGQEATAINATYVHANEVVDTRLDEIVSQKRGWHHSAMNKGEMPVWNESDMMNEIIKAIVNKKK